MLSAPIDLALVRRLFSDPQKLLEGDFLNREIALRMREKLELVKISPTALLDAGCGTGADLAELQRAYPQAQVIGLDAAAAMLSHGRLQQQAALSAVGRLLAKWTPSSLRSERAAMLMAADFATMPMAAQSLDLIWSNLALHWHPQPNLVMAEWRRVLRTEGLLMFSCFGPDTLVELRSAFAAVDAHVHTLPFVDMHDYGDMLIDAGFSTPVMDMEKITLTYQTPQRLLADVRALGGNPLQTRQRGLMSKRQYRALLDVLEMQRSPAGLLELTYEVVYGHAFRPVSRKTSAGEAIVRFDLPKK
ncbi:MULTISPECIES: methyltransferase domain-containing protein [unclassified Undibacterium]|uniref:methyltransferase domain-containing protein n=1 Tax=unclassified Undibacterium TaxID=2630295 RepID=UPI002AC90474|nr:MULTISPECIES: methyltransferase domain-containing protein [unclassified Undibacterium]MEB0139023.1 methyltransferase domain-containing protein [Undibacterium sp. CCC2.1]MEB0171882.1 methyltransferase domain-containing protein [Undibacterium sp. CCC1.1]MEB0175823.1 methyltransferase domain-containing protein [Undibacterium sp. CCC3.4]MEB0215111.1 methyltransferase domain-containing protein [Undibacterium sp. 5I2]WPX45078.1 methyltransferase domain-containing protein [Undibacterium sp. CCC3.4